jgi:hypothetical protein
MTPEQRHWQDLLMTTHPSSNIASYAQWLWQYNAVLRHSHGIIWIGVNYAR